MKTKSLVIPFLVSAGALFMALYNPSEAKAYSVTFNGRTAGNPSGQPLRDIGLHSGDIGRTLDPTIWSLSAGTSNDGGETLTQSILGRAVITVLDLTKDVLKLQFDISNLTDSSYQAAITGLWFGVTPDATGANFNSSGQTFDAVRVDPDGNAPGGFKNIDICIYATKNCEGGKIGDGLQAGESDSFIVSIFGNFGVYNPDGTYSRSAVTISDLGTKWQTEDGSYQVAGVPEPMTILGSGAALGFGAIMKRRAAKGNSKKDEEKAVV